MTTMFEELKAIILRALPTIDENTVQKLINQLQTSGLESIDDLKYVRQEDIADLLPIIQQRKLLDAFKMETEIITLNLQIEPTATSPGSSVLSSLPCSTPSSVRMSTSTGSSSQENCEPPSLIRKAWTETFQVPWNLMPVEVQTAISEGKRPSPAARRQMVRVLADEMRKYDLNPTRSQCLSVCRSIIHQYPKSFADQRENGQLLGGGYTSLLIQLKTRIENLNRTSSFRQHRTSDLGGKRGPTDIYGCTRFQPDLPPEETNDTVEVKQQKLEDIYGQEGVKGSERSEVKQLMETTFCLQRRHINALPAPAIADVRDKWPYLFTQKGLYAHFELLTDINVLRALEISMEECGKNIVEFFKSKPTNDKVQAVLSENDVELSLRVIQLLMAHFEESIEGLVLFENSFATAADLESMLTLPATPRLLLLGEKTSGRIEHWMVSLEGHIICEGIQPTFLTGLAAVFSTFYNFNLQYQEEAACTLEFIQRRFVGINPERGTKAGRGKVPSKKTGRVIHKKITTVNRNVSTLLRKLVDFEWDFI
ncbi:hypothetical protein SRHO_G00308010 [Serrasalmus rhombeus]